MRPRSYNKAPSYVRLPPAGAFWLAALVLVAGSAAKSDAQRRRPDPPYEVTEQRAACAEYTPERRPFFGDLHVHTVLSQDASTQGTRNRPADAYRFARGEELGIQPYDSARNPLRTMRLERPLDFAAVTDHAELLGEVEICKSRGLPGYRSMVCSIYRRWPRLAFFMMNSRSSYVDRPERYAFCGPDGGICLAAARGPWQEIAEAAEGAYDRSSACSFTSFVGYEWTGGPGSNNLHRNVIFRGETVPHLPVSYYEAPRPGLLWKKLDDECLSKPGCDVLVIPHNSNLSGGTMFTLPEDGPSAEVAERRSRFEPLVEVIQHKGDSECIPGAGSNDEECGFEKLPYANFQQKYVPFLAEPPGHAGTVRYALEKGLEVQAKVGANPFRLGMIGSTDTHLGTPGAADEFSFAGHGGAGVPSQFEVPPGLPDDLEFNPGGLAVLWAEENSRDALFAAMRRREAYATSGPRIVLRMFGGFDLSQTSCNAPDFAARGYAEGVAMGGILTAGGENKRAAGKAPVFAIGASADPGTSAHPGSGIEQVQIVKSWVGPNGSARTKVFDVAGEKSAQPPRACDTPEAGKRSICAVWRDPEFDPGKPASYYARVLEVPTCRWSERICRARAVDCDAPETVTEGLEPCCSPDHERTIRERAWSSPIWYDPPQG